MNRDFERLDRKCGLERYRMKRNKRWLRLNEDHRIACFVVQKKRDAEMNKGGE